MKNVSYFPQAPDKLPAWYTANCNTKFTTAFAVGKFGVFLYTFNLLTACKEISGAGCRGPPFHHVPLKK